MTEIVREVVTTPDAWVGPEIQNDDSWIIYLDAAANAEIDAALGHAKQSGATIPFSAELFPIPTFSAQIEQIVERISHGLGVVMLRGLDRDRYSNQECELIYWGLSVHMGIPVSQNTRGHLLGHVTDEGVTLADPDARGYQTRNRLDFHCDQLPVDILGLFCLRTAKSGGTSYLVSATTLHNTILEERPDLIDLLYVPFHVDWRGDHPQGGQPWYDVPMFSARDGIITARVTNRSFLASVSRYGDHLALTDAQAAAMEVVQEIANRPNLRLSMDFQEGDMQFINNHTVLHARQAYDDFDDPDLKRHLLRMWIALPDERRRPLSPILDERYSYVESGGIAKWDAA
jgi:hypothetical protein